MGLWGTKQQRTSVLRATYDYPFILVLVPIVYVAFYIVKTTGARHLDAQRSPE